MKDCLTCMLIAWWQVSAADVVCPMPAVPKWLFAPSVDARRSNSARISFDACCRGPQEDLQSLQAEVLIPARTFDAEDWERVVLPLFKQVHSLD